MLELCHVAIVLTRYMLLVMGEHQNEDQRTFGGLFSFLVDEMADITFNRFSGILMDTLEQRAVFIANFEAKFPKYLRNALHPEAVAA